MMIAIQCHRHLQKKIQSNFYHTTSKSLKVSRTNLLQIHPEVQEAIQTSKPVVALESTILSHGLPYPENLHLSRDISKIIRSKDVVPATIAVKNGRCHVGLSNEDLSDLVLAGVEGRATKCSTRDLPFLMKRNEQQRDSLQNSGKAQWGGKVYEVTDISQTDSHTSYNTHISCLFFYAATTVASTMRLAHMAGISTFVTGGTGGVHRGAEITMDVSADLIELSRTPVIVVSAGIKSILDISKTLETLETYGVPTASYQTDDFPAFFSSSSGVKSPMRVDTPEEVANAYFASIDLGLNNGMLVAVPNYDPAGANVEDAIQETLDEATKLGIEGRDVTPFILKRVSERTGGDSLRSNTALVKHNADVGADIAISIANEHKKRSENDGNGNFETMQYCDHNLAQSKGKSSVVVVGGAVMDIVAKSKSRIIPNTSNPGSCKESDGGVGRNIAEVLGQLGAKPLLFTAVGDDSRGKALRQRMEDQYDIPPNRQFIKVVPHVNTATYLATLDSDGDLHNAIADMDILTQIPLPNDEILSNTKYLVLDANAPIEKLVEVVQKAKSCETLVVFDPTSVPKTALLKGNKGFWSCISFAFPNLDELIAMTSNDKIDRETILQDNFQNLKMLAAEMLTSMHPSSAHLIVTLGSNGVFLASKGFNGGMEFKHVPVREKVDVENCTGAGDTMVGVFVKGLLEGKEVSTCVEQGMVASLESIKTIDRAIPQFSAEALYKLIGKKK